GFFVTLILLRYLTDKTIPGNVNVHVAIDRAGGGIFGFLTGMVCVGVMLIGAQMLPLGRSTLGFERYTRLSDGSMHRNTLAWFNPDGFTAGLVNMLTEERFSGSEAKFDRAKPDFLDNLYYRHAGTQGESRMAVPGDCIKVTDVYTVPQLYKLDFTATKEGEEPKRKTDEVVSPENASNVFMVCNLEINRDQKVLETDYDEQGNAVQKDFILF